MPCKAYFPIIEFLSVFPHHQGRTSRSGQVRPGRANHTSDPPPTRGPLQVGQMVRDFFRPHAHPPPILVCAHRARSCPAAWSSTAVLGILLARALAQACCRMRMNSACVSVDVDAHAAVAAPLTCTCPHPVGSAFLMPRRLGRSSGRTARPPSTRSAISAPSSSSSS